jgi:hypothetical protein
MIHGSSNSTSCKDFVFYDMKKIVSCVISPHQILTHGIQFKAESADRIDMHYNLCYTDYM